MESRGSAGELLHPNTHGQLQTRQEEMGLAHGYYLTIPAGGRKSYLPPVPATTQPMKVTILLTPTLLQWTFCL